MDGIANVAQQQSQIIHQDTQTKAVEHNATTTQHSAKTSDVIEELNDTTKEQLNNSISNNDNKINSKDEVEKLTEKLNDALSPFDTNIKFGVDSNDIFYVSVIESKTNKMIRRFPAEEAQKLLPKMEEVTGILFDSKG